MTDAVYLTGILGVRNRKLGVYLYTLIIISS